MNDNLPQHSAQTPSPSTGSRQDTHKVGSAMSSASFAACGPRAAERADCAAQARRADRCGLCLHRFEASAEPASIARERSAAYQPDMPPDPTAPRLFDRALLARRLARAQKLEPATFLLDRVAEDMADRLAAVNREFAEAADVWTPGEGLSLPGLNVRHVDIAVDESLPFAPGSLDLAVSALAFQFVNDLPGVLAQIRRALKPDGLLLAALIGGDTLTELRQSFAAAETEIEGGVSPRVAPFADLRDIGALLQRAGLALPVTDVDRVVVRYDNALGLMAICGAWARPTFCLSGDGRRPAARRCCAWRRSMHSAFPMPTDASARLSISSGCRPGRRMRASPNRCGRARRRRVWRRR